MNQAYVTRIVGLLGERKGKEWLNNIPHLLDYYSKKWSVKIFDPFPLSYKYVAPVERADGSKAVIKIGFKGNKEFFSEVAALQALDRHASAQLLEIDIDNAVLLLERVLPGLPLTTISDNTQATQIAACVAKKLWITAPSNNHLFQLDHVYKGFQTMRSRFNLDFQPIPKSLFNKAEELFSLLLQTTKEPTLLHGDFHQGNILSSEKEGWITVDPKGMIGDPIYDLAVFLYNPLPWLVEQKNLEEILTQRVTIFSEELGFPKKRIVEWALAQSILSSIWSIEDNGEGWQYTNTCAEVFETLLKK